MSLNIKIPKSIENEMIGKSFNSLFIDIISKIESTEEDTIVWDFSDTMILNPFFLLPLYLYKQSCGKKITLHNISPYVDKYFKAIHFYEIFDAESHSDNLTTMMDEYAEKRYIPITRFPASVLKDTVRNRIISTIGGIFRKQLNISGNLYGGISYLLSEIIDNIVEHSRSEFGYIFAQYYRKNKYIDICIADEGVTLLGSYLQAEIEDIADDLEAIQKASIGVSAKNLPDAENRGYGIVTSRKMLVDGLKGHFFLFSGGAFYRYFSQEGAKSTEQYVKLPKEIKWDGTIVLLRVPYNENNKFNYINYLEG